MSLLYKNPEDVTIEVDIKILPTKEIEFDFSADCGKFGTDELIDYYKLTPKRLLEILNKEKNYSDNEI